MSRIIRYCPHCGSTDGVTIYNNLYRVPYNMGFMGEEQYNGEMYDNADYEEGKMAYCQNCGKLICRMSTLENSISVRKSLGEKESSEVRK